jgi:acetyl esterase/lipase
VAVLAAIVLLTAACSGSRDTPVGDGEQAAGSQGTTIDPVDLAPDPLPDPGVEPGTCKIVTYTPPTAREAQKGELCRPADNQRNVAVMVVHGGSGIGGSYDGMRPWANRLTAEGYVVFLPDYHLFTPGAGGPVFPWPEQNVKAAVQYLRGTAKATGISRRNIVVQGMSAGARIGAVAYATPGDDYFAGPELWPDIDDTVDGFIGFYHPYDGSMQYSSQYYGGSDESSDAKVRERWDEADALANAADVRGPALLITGSKDWDLIEQQQEQFASAIETGDHDARTVVITGGSHGFDTGTASRLSRLGEQAATEVLRWLNAEFPQQPPREAETSDVDLATAPDRSGEPPTTYQLRTRPSTSGSTTTTRPSNGASSTTTSAPKSSSTSSTSTSTTEPPSTSSSSTTTTTVAG